VNAQDIEIAVARRFDYRRHIIVPNVSWGLFRGGMEIDLLIVKPSGWATEIEIKVSGSDIKRDAKKHRHYLPASFNELLRSKYFAVPEKLADHPDIPMSVGIIKVGDGGYTQIVRPAALNKRARKLTEEEIRKVLELGCMRIWTLKDALKTAKARKQIQPPTGAEK
jgi:hypothetical protein